LEINLDTNIATFGANVTAPNGVFNSSKGLIAGGTDNGSVIFYRNSNPYSLGSTDAVLMVSDRSSSDWGIIIDKSGYDYGQRIDTSNGATYALSVYDGASYTFRINGAGKAFTTNTSASAGAGEFYNTYNLTASSIGGGSTTYVTIPTNYSGTQNSSASLSSVGWYRIANLGGAHFYARVLIQDGTSSGPHSTQEFIVAGAFNDLAGLSFTQTTGASYGGNAVNAVRVLTASTYDAQYLEVYIPYLGASPATFSVSILNGRNATILPFNGGSQPGGYTATQWSCGNSFAAGNGSGLNVFTSRGDANLHFKSTTGIRFDGSSNAGTWTTNTANTWGITNVTSDGYISIGPANSSYAHIYTDRPYFYFNQVLQRSGYTVWDSGNLTNLNQLTNGPGYIANNTAGDWNIASSTNGNTSYTYSTLELREANFGGNSGYSAPRLGFHWGGVVASQIGIESSGRISILNNPGSGYENLIGNSLYATNFYYASNTAYGIIGTNSYMDTMNSANGSADSLEIVYYTNSANVRIGTGSGGNQGLYAGGLYDNGAFTATNTNRPLSQQGNSYYQWHTWLEGKGNFGMYWPGFSASAYAGTPYWYPNYDYTYGGFALQGYRNSYSGIYYVSSSGTTGNMFDTGGNGGDYDTSTGWHFYWYRPYSCLGIGGSSTASGYRARTNGSHYVDSTLYAGGEVYAYSDRRKKKDIVTVDNALNKVLQLRGVYYKRIDDEDIVDDIREPGKQLLGVIAQEVEPIVPQVVTHNKDFDEYSVSYGNFSGLFIEAFKDINQLVQAQKEQIELLKKEIELLKGKE
jgi:hypothetical protein